jgi:hypothetical protein
LYCSPNIIKVIKLRTVKCGTEAARSEIGYDMTNPSMELRVMFRHVSRIRVIFLFIAFNW